MLSRPAGLVSLGNRQQPPLPTALRWRREKRTFYLSGRSALSFASFAPSLRSPTSPGSGRAASVDLPPVGLWVQSDKSLPPAPTGRARGRGDLGRTLLCPKVCISRPARQKPPHCRGVLPPRPGGAQLRAGLSSPHPHSAPSVFVNDRRPEDTSDGGGSGYH